MLTNVFSEGKTPFHNKKSRKLSMEKDDVIQSYVGICSTSVEAYNDRSQMPKFVAVVDRWSSFRGSSIL
jgi:hypothetical protein